jgi:small subunit ribosomal protein S8
MSLSDPIADLLTRIRNAKMAKHRCLDLSYSKLKLAIIKVLKDQGFVENFLVDEENRKIRIFLKYSQSRECVVQNLKRISSPGLRRYIGYREIPKILGGLGIAILSTPQGIIDGESARKMKVGGELLCTIW